MDIKALIGDMSGCSCGRNHTVDIKAVEIGRGIKAHAAEILSENEFPKAILVVGDKNTMKASDGLLNLLKAGGFDVKTKIYDDLRVADMDHVNEVRSLSKEVDGILSVGTGSLNDICRYASALDNKQFAIFATAPSMDGFASDTAPITENGFKTSRQCRQPQIILGDTEILAAAPSELKSAGFGDMIAKYIGLVDWKVSHYVTGEHYCEATASLTRNAVDKLCTMADKVTLNDPETAGTIMESLLMTGIAMKFEGSSRPASGTEHVISHYLEIKELEDGIISDFHGKKVGVATLMSTKIYHDIINIKNIEFCKDSTDWTKVYTAYGPAFKADIDKMNSPTVTDETSPEILRENWDKIVEAVHDELMPYDKMLDLMKRAGAVTTISEIDIPYNLALDALKYHPYMRHRMTLARLIPMMDAAVDYESVIQG